MTGQHQYHSVFITFSLDGHSWVRRLWVDSFHRHSYGSVFSAHETSCPQALQNCSRVLASGSILGQLVPLQLYVAFSVLAEAPLSLKSKSQGSLQTTLSCCSLKNNNFLFFPSHPSKNPIKCFLGFGFIFGICLKKIPFCYILQFLHYF